MTDHSPDHAERAAQQMLADRGRFPSGGEVPFDVTLSLIAAALRGRDRVVEDLTTALHDAISRPAGVVPASAEPFYDWRRYDRGPVRDAKEPRP